MNRSAVILLLCLPAGIKTARAQADSSRSSNMDTVSISAFQPLQKTIACGSVVRVIFNNTTDNGPKSSLLSALNTVPGVRMEERSPGSYRLNFRGSSLRSPFGVRNVKVYWNHIPVTDPGGNTYFNQFVVGNFDVIELNKGPAGSMYGAGTGGLALLHTHSIPFKPLLSAEWNTGSFGQQNLFLKARLGGKENDNLLTYTRQQTDGYRQQTAMRRHNLMWTSRMRVGAHQILTASLLYNDLTYQTPGALTRAEFDVNPRAARPAGGGLPSAETARAAIYQKNFMAGIHNQFNWKKGWEQHTVLYGAYARINNPAIRNYEKRSEPHGGGRSWLSWKKTKGSHQWQITGGAEWQRGKFSTRVFRNKQGIADTLQTDDETDYRSSSAFGQVEWNWKEDWFITAGASLNSTAVEITRLNKFPVSTQSRRYNNEWAPRLNLARRWGSRYQVFLILSKGFSPPTLAEILPSTGIISTSLEAEQGWNYEAGGRLGLWSNRFFIEMALYQFRLQNALVQRRDVSGADFYVNAGGTRQSGAEATLEYFNSFRASAFTDYIRLRGAVSLHHYRYTDLKKDTVDFSGKTLPGIPSATVSVTGDVYFHNGAYLHFTAYRAARQFLNDANSAEGEAYTLLGVKLGWRKKILKKMQAEVYGGAENLLGKVYSPGFDINDPRGRFFNAGFARSFYAGLILSRGQ